MAATAGIAGIAGLPRPELVSGRLDALAAPAGPAGSAGSKEAAVLPWGETPSVAALRRRLGAKPASGSTEVPPAGPTDGGEAPPPAGTPPWLAALRRLPPASPEVVARVADRRFCLEVAESSGLAFPGARTVGSVAELAAFLRDGGAGAGGGAWVAKAPWSAAGRHRVIAPAAGALEEDPTRRRVERLLEAFGALVVEPWVPRLADYGTCASVDPDGGVVLIGTHRLEVDGRGAFTGIVLADPEPVASRALGEAARAVGDRLAAAGYAGPFGIDGFTWRSPSGAVRLHPLSEINPRLTFGFVARALAARLGLPATARPAERRGGAGGVVALRFGRPAGRGGAAEGSGRRVPLLEAGPEAPGAWLDFL